MSQLNKERSVRLWRQADTRFALGHVRFRRNNGHPPLELKARDMTRPLREPSKHATSAQTPSWNILKFSKKQLALAFGIAGVSDAIGAFITPLPPITWIADLATALLLFMVLGRQCLLLPGLALEAIPGLGILPFWLLVV